MEIAQAKIVIEAALLTAGRPLALADLRRLFDGELAAPEIERALTDLEADWSQRAVRLVRLAGGWRFQSIPDVAPYMARLNPEKPQRYSRAVLETLAIIAYRQPVTRGDIEDIRGVTVSSQVVKALEERGWIEVIGHKDVIGRPALFATTRQFLDDLGLRSLEELPALAQGHSPESAVAVLGQQVIAFDAPAGLPMADQAADPDGGAAAAEPLSIPTLPDAERTAP
jgi:segregation and condensation protein B